MDATLGTPRVCDRVEIKVYKRELYVLEVGMRLGHGLPVFIKTQA